MTNSNYSRPIIQGQFKPSLGKFIFGNYKLQWMKQYGKTYSFREQPSGWVCVSPDAGILGVLPLPKADIKNAVQVWPT